MDRQADLQMSTENSYQPPQLTLTDRFVRFIIHRVVGKAWPLAPSALHWIQANLPEGNGILEFGSGTSTGILSRHYRMISVEQDAAWLGKHDSQYVHAPIVDGWYDLDVMQQCVFGRRDYDLIIIDGPTETSGSRDRLLDHFHLMRRDVPVLIDDIYRPHVRRFARRLISLLGGKKDVRIVRRLTWTCIVPNGWCPQRRASLRPHHQPAGRTNSATRQDSVA